MRIAIFTETFPPKIDGISNRLRHTVEELLAAGHEVRVFGPATAVEEHAGAQVVRVPGLPFPPYPGLRVTVPGPRTAWELVRFRPEVVHAVCPASLGAWGLVTARALRIPAVASYHTDFPRYAGHHGLGFAEGAKAKSEASAAEKDWNNAMLWANQWWQYQVKTADLGLRAKTFLEENGAKKVQ